MSENIPIQEDLVTSLLDSGIAAFFAAIEIHNKPNIAYRYQTTTILLLNSWELVLKAYLCKYYGETSIWNNEEHTISLKQALEKFSTNALDKFDKNYIKPLKNNLIMLEKYRNKFSHSNTGKIDPVIFSVILKSVEFYDKFIKIAFEKRLEELDNLIIMPIGLSFPYNPIDFLKQSEGKTNEFCLEIINKTKELLDEGIENTIFTPFYINLNSEKKPTNADIIAVIGNEGIHLKNTKEYRLSNDKGVQAITINDDELRKLFPLNYNLVCKMAKLKNPSIKQDNKFHQIMKEIKQDKEISYGRRANIYSKKSPITYCYNEKAVEILLERYNKQ